MKTQEELTLIVAKNLIAYRKKLGLTQMQLAELISYSDKAISKWERAEALPDVFVLSQIADVFKITVNDLLTEPNEKKLQNLEQEIKELNKTRTRNRVVISLLSYCLVWFIAIVCFAISKMSTPESPSWLAFIYAIPTGSIVLLVFAKIWGTRWIRSIIVSFLTWSIALCLQLSIDVFAEVKYTYLFYVIAAGFQILILFWYLRRKK